MTGRPPSAPLDRLMRAVVMCPMSGCWLFTGPANPNGYGYVRIGDTRDGSRKKHPAHRLSWELHHGAIPDGSLVCHRCDVPACVNPAHLFLGTHRDNTLDMHAKGRGFVPEPHYHPDRMRDQAGRFIPEQAFR